MSDESSQYYDIPSLLRLDCISIKTAARNDLNLLTGDYFRTLSKFLQVAPQIKESINKFSAAKGEEEDLVRLADSRALVEAVGSDKLTAPINEIIRAGRRGHNDFAADCAKKITGDFDKIVTGVISAKKEKSPEANENNDAKPLHVVLKTLEQEEATRKMRILAVDDDPIVIETITSLLGEEYKVFGMTNQAMLENFLQQIIPELFLLDYKMPGRNGFELIPIIRSFAEHKDTPIIFLTSMGTVDHVSAAAALGACDFIVKPFQDNMLREKIAKHIVKKKLF
jgi:PleD family two-component response regulator